MQPQPPFYDAATDAFLQDVVHGLTQHPKTLPCKWFYDEKGSILFEQITQTPEYYLTRAESRLLHQVASELPALLPSVKVIIEPGSGSSQKTRILLDELVPLTHYFPMDISADFLFGVANDLRADYPNIEINPIVADFTQQPLPKPQTALGNLVFFPGSTIGNFSQGAATDLLSSFHELAGKQGHLLIGVDCTQDKNSLIAAYDDAADITAQFNLNLLVRANKALGADFDLKQFKHQVRWVPELHRIEMHIESLVQQSVNVGSHTFNFAAGETIFTESCHKYPKASFEDLAKAAGWQLIHDWSDNQQSGFHLFLFNPS